MLRPRLIALIVCVVTIILLSSTLSHAKPTSATPSTLHNNAATHSTSTGTAPIKVGPIDPDFAAMALSAEEEEKLIQQPARREREQVIPGQILPNGVKIPIAYPVDPSKATVPKPLPIQPKKSELITIALNSKSSIGDICKQLPASDGTSSSLGLSLSHLSRLLRSLWFDSGLINAGQGEHLLRIKIEQKERELLGRALNTANSGSNDLNEEDLPEIMEASMNILKQLEIDLEAQAHLRIYENEHINDDILLDDSPAPIKPSFLWRFLSRCLQFAHLHPGTAEEFDAFWAILVGLTLCISSMGIGFAWGVKSDRKSIISAIDQGVKNGPNSGGASGSLGVVGIDRSRLRTPRQLFCANFCWIIFWLFLLTVVLFLIGYIHLFLEIQTENRALASVAKSKPVPRECRMTPEELQSSQSIGSRLLEVASSFSPFLPRIRDIKETDKCVKYWQEYYRSTTPNPAYVLTQFLSRAVLGPVTMTMEALGEGSYKLLSHHSFVLDLSFSLSLSSNLLRLFLILILSRSSNSR